MQCTYYTIKSTPKVFILTQRQHSWHSVAKPRLSEQCFDQGFPIPGFRVGGEPGISNIWGSNLVKVIKHVSVAFQLQFPNQPFLCIRGHGNRLDLIGNILSFNIWNICVHGIQMLNQYELHIWTLDCADLAKSFGKRENEIQNQKLNDVSFVQSKPSNRCAGVGASESIKLERESCRELGPVTFDLWVRSPTHQQEFRAFIVPDHSPPIASVDPTFLADCPSLFFELGWHLCIQPNVYMLPALLYGCCRC